MADPNAKTAPDLASVRERARQHILGHGCQARAQARRDAGDWTPDARARFAALVDEALAGARRSQNHLAAQLLPILRAAALTELRLRAMPHQRARQLAHDIANDVYVELLKDNARVLRGWRASSARHDPRAYFRTIARRRAIDAYRRDQRTVPCDTDDLPRNPATGTTTVETALMIRECMRRTIGRHRNADVTQHMIYDALIADARQSDIACDLGISADAIYQRTSRFRREFASTWNQE